MDTNYSDACNNAKTILSKIILEKGCDIILNIEELDKLLKENKCDDTIRLQLLVFLKNSNIHCYLPQLKSGKGLCMVDINNIVMYTEKSGLNRGVVKNILGILLSGMSAPTDLSVVKINNGGKYELKDVNMSDFAKFDKDIVYIRSAVARKDSGYISSYQEQLNNMAKAGYPEALYLMGKCYLEGIGTVKDEDKAYMYIENAANAGNRKACALMGKRYFDSDLPFYTRAYQYYSTLGATNIDGTGKKNFCAILDEKKVNRKVIALNAVLFVLMIVFDIIMAKGMFSLNGATHWICGTFAIVLSTLVFTASLLFHHYFKYDSIKWLTVIMICITLIFAIIAL